MSEVQPFCTQGMMGGHQKSLKRYVEVSNVLYHTVEAVLQLAEEGLDVNKATSQLRDAAAKFHEAAYGGELPHILQPEVGVKV